MKLKWLKEMITEAKSHLTIINNWFVLNAIPRCDRLKQKIIKPKIKVFFRLKKWSQAKYPHIHNISVNWIKLSKISSITLKKRLHNKLKSQFWHTLK